jgi:hypothetical protein
MDMIMRITHAWAPPHSDRPVPLIHCESLIRAPAPSHRPPIPSRWASAGVWVSCVAITQGQCTGVSSACYNNGAPLPTGHSPQIMDREHMQGLLWLHAFKHSLFVPSMQCVNGLFSGQLQAIGAKGFIDVAVSQGRTTIWCFTSQVHTSMHTGGTKYPVEDAASHLVSPNPRAVGCTSWASATPPHG